MINLSLLFALLNVIIAGLGKVMLKKGLNTYNPSVIFAIESIFGLFFWTSFAMFSEVEIYNLLRILPIIFISAVLSEAFVFYVYSKGEISIIVPIFSTYSLFTVFFSVLINNEVLSTLQLISVLLIFLGVFTISLDLKNLKINKGKITSITWGLLGALAVGISDSISKNSIDTTNAATFLFGLAFIQILISIIYLKIEKSSVHTLVNIFKKPTKNFSILLGTSFIAFSMIFFWLTFESTLASIASPLTATVSLVVVIFASIFLKEKLTLEKIIATILIIIGVALITS